MDILHLVDRLEEILKKSPGIRSTRLVNAERIWPLIDQMRISIPDEVRRAQRIACERDQILAEARERAAQLMREAEERAAELASDHAIVQAAEARATTIREKAERDADVLRGEANEYVFDTLCQLEEEMRRSLQVVENGVRRIQAEQAAAEERRNPEA